MKSHEYFPAPEKKKNPRIRKKKVLNLHNFSEATLLLKTNSGQRFPVTVTLTDLGMLRQLRSKLEAESERVWSQNKLPGFSRKIMGFFFSDKEMGDSS